MKADSMVAVGFPDKQSPRERELKITFIKAYFLESTGIFEKNSLC